LVAFFPFLSEVIFDLFGHKIFDLVPRAPSFGSVFCNSSPPPPLLIDPLVYAKEPFFFLEYKFFSRVSSIAGFPLIFPLLIFAFSDNFLSFVSEDKDPFFSLPLGPPPSFPWGRSFFSFNATPEFPFFLRASPLFRVPRTFPPSPS